MVGEGGWPEKQESGEERLLMRSLLLLGYVQPVMCSSEFARGPTKMVTRRNSLPLLLIGARGVRLVVVVLGMSRNTDTMGMMSGGRNLRRTCDVCGEHRRGVGRRNLKIPTRVVARWWFSGEQDKREEGGAWLSAGDCQEEDERAMVAGLQIVGQWWSPA
jgi:hypothetical protein